MITRVRQTINYSAYDQFVNHIHICNAYYAYDLLSDSMHIRIGIKYYGDSYII